MPESLSEKKIFWPWYFPVNFAKFLRAPFSTEHLLWLLLYIKITNERSSAWCLLKATGSFKHVRLFSRYQTLNG